MYSKQFFLSSLSIKKARIRSSSTSKSVMCVEYHNSVLDVFVSECQSILTRMTLLISNDCRRLASKHYSFIIVATAGTTKYNKQHMLGHRHSFMVADYSIFSLALDRISFNLFIMNFVTFIDILCDDVDTSSRYVSAAIWPIARASIYQGDVLGRSCDQRWTLFRTRFIWKLFLNAVCALRLVAIEGRMFSNWAL